MQQQRTGTKFVRLHNPEDIESGDSDSDALLINEDVYESSEDEGSPTISITPDESSEEESLNFRKRSSFKREEPPLSGHDILNNAKEALILPNNNNSKVTTYKDNSPEELQILISPFDTNNNNNDHFSQDLQHSLMNTSHLQKKTLSQYDLMLEEEQELLNQRDAMDLYKTSTTDPKQNSTNIHLLNTNSNSTNHRQPRTIRDFTDFVVEVGALERVMSPDEIRIIQSLPPTGFGTVAPPEDDGLEDEIYPACALFILGFFCVFPWVAGILYIKSRNPAARTAGIISTISGALTIFVILMVGVRGA